MAARVVFIKWIVTFFLEKTYLTTAQNTKNGGDILPKIMQVCHSSSFYIFICIYYHTLTHMKYLIIRVIGSCRLLVMRPQFLCVLSKMPRFHKKLELEALVLYWHCHDEAVLKVRGGILRRWLFAHSWLPLIFPLFTLVQWLLSIRPGPVLFFFSFPSIWKTLRNCADRLWRRSVRLPSALWELRKNRSAAQDFGVIVEPCWGPWKRRLLLFEVLGEDFLYGAFWFLLALVACIWGLTSMLSSLGT